MSYRPNRPPSQQTLPSQMIDKAISDCEKGGGETTIEHEGKKYKVYVNTRIDGLSENEIPEYIKKRIKKADE